MLRFVDVREADIGGSFAFFDTVSDTFVSLGDDQVWVSARDLAESWRRHYGTGDGGTRPLSRFLNLLPDWVARRDDE